MLFKEEINKCFSAKNGYFLEINESGGYVQGVNKIITFEKDQIQLIISEKKHVLIKGENFCIKKFLDGDICFYGKIVSVEVF